MLEMAYGFMLARRALMFAGVLFAGCCALWAQSEPQSDPSAGGPGMYHHGPERGPERELTELTQVLTLSPEQQTQVKALLTTQQQQVAQIRSQAATNGASDQAAQPNREKFAAIRQDTDTKINALLNDDQKTKFAAWQQQRQQRMQHRRGGEGQEGAPAPQGA